MSQKITDIPAELLARVEAGEIGEAKLRDYREFLHEVENRLMNHRIVVQNRFCQFVEENGFDREQARKFVQQFSVFSHLFLIAQMKKMINASDLASYRAAKEILANELGVIFRRPGQAQRVAGGQTEDEKDLSGDPELVGTEGSVEGGTFRFSAGHFEWLLRIGEQLGLTFSDMGKRSHGTAATLFFCDELDRIYGSADPNIGEGASFAVENWAAAGFWKQLVRGLKRLKEHEIPDLRLAFFTWHDALEDRHAENTQAELAEMFFKDGFDKQKFLKGGLEMLDGVAAFWDGLYDDLVVPAMAAGRR
jgi:hypothetical protein